MADKKFSQLPDAGELTGEELFALARDGKSQRTTLDQIASYIGDGGDSGGAGNGVYFKFTAGIYDGGDYSGFNTFDPVGELLESVGIPGEVTELSRLEVDIDGPAQAIIFFVNADTLDVFGSTGDRWFSELSFLDQDGTLRVLPGRQAFTFSDEAGQAYYGWVWDDSEAGLEWIGDFSFQEGHTYMVNVGIEALASDANVIFGTPVFDEGGNEQGDKLFEMNLPAIGLHARIIEIEAAGYFENFNEQNPVDLYFGFRFGDEETPPDNFSPLEGAVHEGEDVPVLTLDPGGIYDWTLSGRIFGMPGEGNVIYVEAYLRIYSTFDFNEDKHGELVAEIPVRVSTLGVVDKWFILRACYLFDGTNPNARAHTRVARPILLLNPVDLAAKFKTYP